MTKETEKLATKIKQAKGAQIQKETIKKTKTPSGYQVITEVIVNLFGCILVGTSLGVISNNLFATGDKFTIMLALLGGIAGIWSVIKYAMSVEKESEAK